MLIYQGTPVREQFDIVDDDDKVYLRAANICPCATSVAAAVDDFVNVWRREGDACWGLVESAFEEGKALFAKLIGADSGEIATIENTSMGLSIAASLIAPPPGSNVVVDELTHQSNVYPWMLRSQVELRYARSDRGRVALSEFECLVDENTAAIDVCHVTMGHGFRHDLATLADLAHAHRAYLVVDAAQSAGVVPIDVGEASVDFLSCPTFKWLWGPLGAGFLYVRKDLLKLGPPPLVGWMSARRPAGFDIHSMHLHDDARRLQRGVHNGAGLVAALAGLRIVDELGADTIWHYVRGLSRQLLDGLEEVGLEVLTPTGDEERGGIVAFSVQDAANFNQALSDLGPMRSVALRVASDDRVQFEVDFAGGRSQLIRSVTGVEGLSECDDPAAESPTFCFR